MKEFTKLFVILICICTLSSSVSYSSAEEGDIPSGAVVPESVTMPWGKFMRMWEKYQETEVERSHLFAYEGAVYEGVATVDKHIYYLKFTATIHLTSFSDEKILVPVISAELSPEKMLLDSNPSGYTKKGGHHCIILQRRGSHTVESSFTISFDAQRWPRNFVLPLVPIARSEVTLNVTDSDIEAKFEPGVVLKTDSSDISEEGDRITGVVPAVGATSIRWLKRSQKREMIPLKKSAVVHSYISLAENGASIKSEVDFQILQGETHYFQVQVPNNIDILDVTAMGGDDKISQWYAEDTSSGRMVHIYASYRHKKKFSVLLDCERTVASSNYQFTIPRLVPHEVERYENLIAVGSEANVEISESVLEQAEGRDVRFVPEEIQMFAKGRALFYYKVLGDDFTLSFDVKSHEKATVVKTRIESLTADSVITEVGTVMTKATYKVKNNQAQFLDLTLPKGAKLLSAFTNGREIQPVVTKDTLLIPLDKSTNASFPVEIAWLSKIGSLGVFGKQSVQLPHSPVSVDLLSWRLYTPEAHQMFYFSGNLTHVTSFLGLFASALKAIELPQLVPCAYAGSSKSYKYSGKNVRERFDKGKKMHDDFNLSLRSSQVQVQIPVTGNTYTFSSYLVKGFTPEVSFWYMSDALKQILGFVYGVLAIFASFLSLGLIFNRVELLPRTPPGHYWLLTAGVLAFFIFVSIFFKLGVFSHVLTGLTFGLVLFAFWQNRQESKKFHGWVSGKRAYFPELLLILLVLFLAIPAITGEYTMAALTSLFSIVFHGTVFRGLQWVSNRKRIKKDAINLASVLLALLVITPVAVRASVPGQTAPQSQVTISEKEQSSVKLAWPTVEHMLRTIEEREEHKAKEPQTGYLFGTVQVDGEITEKYTSLRIDVPLRIVTDRNVKIPLVATSTPISKVIYNDRALPLVEDNSMVYFEAGKETEREGLLQIFLSAPVREQGGVKEFKVHSPLLQGGEVELQFGTDIKSVKLYNVSWQKREGRTVRAALGTSPHLRGELATFVRQKDAAGEAEKRVKKRYATTYTLVSLEDEIATFYSSIRYRILNEHVREFKIKLPRDVIVHEIVGEDLEGWKVEKGEQGMNSYIIKVMYPVADRYDLSVRFETHVSANEKSFVIPSLLVEEVARDTGYIGIEMQGRGEIAIERLEKARQIDIQELPDIIRDDAKAPFVYAFRYIERPYNISFTIRKHKGVQMDPAIADRIEYTRVISPQGTLLSQAKIWIRNSRKQYVTFSLPEGARIISTFLDGKSIKPSINEQGTLLLPLKRQSIKPFVLDVVFEEETIALNPMGRVIRLGYPQVDVSVSTVTTNIYVPEKLKVFNTGGDFHKTTHVNYVKWSSHETIEQGGEAKVESNQIEMLSQAHNSIARDSGTRSLKINIPKHGRRIALSAFYIPAGGSLETGFLLVHKYLYGLGYFLAIVVCVVLGGVGRKYYKRPLYWWSGGALLAVFYYVVVYSWMVIVLSAFAGYLFWSLLFWYRHRHTS